MFCPKCGNQYEGNPRFCANCGLTLGQSRAEVTTGPQFTDWFQSHLNWTLVIAFLLITAATVLFSLLASYYIVDDDAYGFVTFVIIVGNIICTAVAAGWVLNQKRRSLLWLLLTPFWLGWIVWLALDNRSQASLPRRVGLTMTAYRCAKCATENDSQARWIWPEHSTERSSRMPSP